MNLLLDTGILGQLCHPAKKANQPVTEWVEAILTSDSGDRWEYLADEFDQFPADMSIYSADSRSGYRDGGFGPCHSGGRFTRI